jgi:glycosyltransferase involved in cell wall biosynthesis
MEAGGRKDTIAFLSTYDHPSRDSIERMIREAFPEYRVETIAVLDLVKKSRHWPLSNLYHFAKEFGLKVARRETTARDSFLRTSYVFHSVRGAMAQLIDPRKYAFSFQVQSLFDFSVPGVPNFVYTDHTHLSNLSYSDFDPRHLRPQRWISLERTIYQNAARTFTRSHNVSADLVNRYAIDPDKVVCVYAGANVPPAADYRLDNDGYSNKRILFIGNDWVRKGGPVLAAAFRSVLRTHPDAHLTIAGANPRLDVANCSVLGSVALDALGPHFARSSIYCLPTRIEPFGISILDAMMHRLPVIASTVGAMPDMVEEGVTGHMVAPGDSELLTERLNELLKDPERCRQYGEAGYNRAAERYTWPAVGAKIRAHVLDCLGRQPPH